MHSIPSKGHIDLHFCIYELTMDNNFRILHIYKGAQLIVHQKYCFIKDKTSKDGITLYYKCGLSKSLKCSARISIISSVISSASGHHH